MSTLLQQLEYAVESKDLIRQAIINKGVDVPARTPLRQYVDKIDAIQAAPPVFTATDTGQVSSVVCRDRLDIPTAVGEQPLSTTFAYTGNRVAITYGCRRLYIPEYFLTSDLGNIFGGRDDGTGLEELHCESVSVTSWGNYPDYLGSIKVLDFPNLTDGIPSISLLTRNALHSELHINIPEATERFHPLIGTADRPIALTLNAPKLLHVGASGRTGTTAPWLQYCTGVWEFPAATELGYFNIPNGEQTIKMPAITTQSASSTFASGGGGLLHLYLGPDMATCASAGSFVLNASHIDIHIPAGESTTKATLDAAGVAYTQDYVI